MIVVLVLVYVFEATSTGPVYEGVLRAVYADFFADQKEEAFANYQVVALTTRSRSSLAAQHQFHTTRFGTYDVSPAFCFQTQAGLFGGLAFMGHALLPANGPTESIWSSGQWLIPMAGMSTQSSIHWS